jgi:hypothetical protein
MEINGEEVTLHPITDEFILTDSLSIGEHTLGSKKKIKKRKIPTKTRRPTKKKSPTKKRQSTKKNRAVKS